jgi:hypothetical protein
MTALIAAMTVTTTAPPMLPYMTKFDNSSNKLPHLFSYDLQLPLQQRQSVWQTSNETKMIPVTISIREGESAILFQETGIGRASVLCTNRFSTLPTHFRSHSQFLCKSCRVVLFKD